MKSPDLEKLKEIWKDSIVGKDINGNFEDIKEYLYKSSVSRDKEILTSLGITITNKTGIEFVKEIVKSFSAIESGDLGFFPVGILTTNKLTCAGTAMLVNTILKDNNFTVWYARPAFHSVNIIKMDDEYYWVDGKNGILDKISVRMEKKDTFSIGHIESNNESIQYRIVPMLKSEEIVVNIFGNMEALKYNNNPDTDVQKYLSDNKDVFEVDFNEYKDLLFKSYFDFVRFDPEFEKEQERVRKWIEG